MDTGDEVTWPVYAAFISWLATRTDTPDTALSALGQLGQDIFSSDENAETREKQDKENAMEELPLSERTLERLDALVSTIAGGSGSVQLPALDIFLDPLRGVWEGRRLRGVKEHLESIEGTGDCTPFQP